MDKDEYEKELVRMWDSLRKDHKGEQSCEGVKCRECPFRKNGECISDSFNAFEMIEIVEKWSNEHQFVYLTKNSKKMLIIGKVLD